MTTTMTKRATWRSEGSALGSGLRGLLPGHRCLEHITGPCRRQFSPLFTLDCMWWQWRQPHCRLLPPGEAQRIRTQTCVPYLSPCHGSGCHRCGNGAMLSPGWQLCDCPQSLSHIHDSHAGSCQPGGSWSSCAYDLCLSAAAQDPSCCP